MYTLQEFRRDVRADTLAYGFARWVFLQSGWWVVLSYRLRRFRKHGPRAARLLLPLDFLLGTFRRLVSDTRIPAAAVIGPGLLLVHSQGIRISPYAVIGAGVRIFHQVTIGQYKGCAPIIGDGCTLFAGARVFGPITVGTQSTIGPNCVVGEDIPAYTIVEVPHFVSRSRKRPSDP
jgi:serine O-acetyltransferase